LNRLKPYLKFVTASLGTVIYAVTAALSDDVVTNSEWVAIATAVMIALGVYTVPNKPAYDEDRKAPVESYKSRPVGGC
jgi:hypothetical protein